MAAKYDSRELRDRLALLLTTQPYEGWEHEFEEITPRHIGRLASAATKADGDRDE